MDICYDLGKNLSNLRKHGIELSLASSFEWGEALVWQDKRIDYGEVRMAAIGYIAERLHFIAYIDRDGLRRIISLRRANLRERDLYAQA